VLPSRPTSRRRAAALIAAACLLVSQPLPASQKNKTTPSLRWTEGLPGCTFSRDPDGKYRYALWTPDFVMTLAVDAQELMLVRRRPERYFSVLLTVRYRGPGALAFDPGQATLEFARHSKVVQPALDPESFAQRIQADLDELQEETRHEVARHPERREERERYVQAYQKEALELIEFVNRRTLAPVRLDQENSEISGWILFSTKNKWIGDWKRPEQFLLRIPLPAQVVEFPFALPPKEGDLILRQRGN
jgi:hypothetical protein